MMRRVPRRVRDLEIAPTGRDAFATRHDDEIPGGHRTKLAPETIHVVAPEPRRARDQLLGIDEVRRASLMYIHAQGRIRTNERAGRARVIEMNVRQENGPQVRDRDARAIELGSERRQGARRPGIDERGPAGTMEDDRRDDARHAEKVEIEIRQPRRECDHDGRFRRARTTPMATNSTTSASPMRPERPIHRSSVSQL